MLHLILMITFVVIPGEKGNRGDKGAKGDTGIGVKGETGTIANTTL